MRSLKWTAIITGMAMVLLWTTPLAAQTGPANIQVLFEANCAACHGPKGDGNTLIGKQLQAKDLRLPEILGKTDAELSAAIVNGQNNKMPPFKGKLKTAEITALLKYMRETLRAKK